MVCLSLTFISQRHVVYKKCKQTPPGMPFSRFVVSMVIYIITSVSHLWMPHQHVQKLSLVLAAYCSFFSSIIEVEIWWLRWRAKIEELIIATWYNLTIIADKNLANKHQLKSRHCNYTTGQASIQVTKFKSVRFAVRHHLNFNRPSSLQLLHFSKYVFNKFWNNNQASKRARFPHHNR